MSTDPAKEIKITNSTGSPIVIMVPTVSAQTQAANATVTYDQAQELLHPVAGASPIAKGETSTFVLDQAYTDPSTGKTEYATVYDLLPSTASWYAPVASIGVVQSFTTPHSYPATTVTAAEAKAMGDAALFLQAVAAYPTSGLATNYTAALNSASANASGQANGSANSSAAVANSIPDTVNAFFKGTKGYQDVTFSAVIAMQSYYATYPFVWAGYKASGTTTYYLYSSNGTATSFVGTLALTPPAKLDLTAVNAGYKCTFTPASNGSDTTNVNVEGANAKNLTYAGSLFVDNPDSDTPAIAVKGTFQIKSTFTGKSADNSIIPVLTGTINNTTCIGFDQAQVSSNQSDSFWDTLFNPKNSAQIFQSIMELGGALMFLAFLGQSLWGIYKFAKTKLAAKEPTTKELFDKQLEDLQKNQQDFYEKLNKQFSGGKDAAITSEGDATAVVKGSAAKVSANESAIKLKKGLDAQADSVQKLGEFEPDMNASQLGNLENAAGDIQTSSAALDGASQADLAQVVKTENPKLPDIVKSVDDLNTSLGDSVDANTKALIAENSNLGKTVSSEVEEATAEEEDLPTENAPKVEDPIIPEV